MSEGKKKVFIAGHAGMVGSAISRRLSREGNIDLITADKKELDLTQQEQVNDFFKKNSIDEVYLAAAKVGGIHANNTFPAEFIYLNLMIESNIIHAAHTNNVKKLLFLGSSCIYPREAPQPLKEDSLLTGKLEMTNEPYAIAKIAGIKLCESYNRQYGSDFRSVMPTNLYGPQDNFHPENSHVIPGLIRRFDEAKKNNDSKVEVWGSGRPMREFLYVDDLADACVFLMNIDKASWKSGMDERCSHINIGTGEDITIKDLAYKIKETVGFDGEIILDTSKPDGTYRKVLSVDKLNSLGWKAQTMLEDGLKEAYKSYLQGRH